MKLLLLLLVVFNLGIHPQMPTPPPPPPSKCGNTTCWQLWLPVVVKPKFEEVQDKVIITDCDTLTNMDDLIWKNVYYTTLKTGGMLEIDTDILGLPGAGISVWAKCNTDDEDPNQYIWGYWLGKVTPVIIK
jgi:hypothetical protein